MPEQEAIMLITAFMMTGFVLVVLLIVRYAQRRLRSREMLAALERGQSLPVRPKRQRVYVDDLRTGVLLVSFSAGLFLFIWVIGGEELAAWAFIPLSIGIGYLINARIGKQHGFNGDSEGVTDSPPNVRPGQPHQEDVSLQPPASPNV